MTWIFTGFLLALFGLSLLLIMLSLRLLRGTALAGDTSCSATRFFLIGLRVAIGWHCFVEGMEKITSPTWSGEAYLREASGPVAGVYRWVPGDRLIARATVGADGSFPAELEREWRDYLNAFAAHHDLSTDQLERARGIFDQRKSDTLTYLVSKSETVTKASAYPPELKLDMNMKQRLEEHERLLSRVRAAEAKFPTMDKEAHAEWRSTKADLAKFRADIKRTLDAETDKLKKIDETERAKLKKSIEADTAKWKTTKDAVAVAKLKETIDENTAKLREPLSDVLTSEQKLKGPMPEPKGMPITSWRLLEFCDFLVKYSLVIFGACLMLGLFSRVTSLATALLILSFYLAMPPLPGWPEIPRLEGHYLIVNKTLIEAIALLALTFIPTGRWAGVDGLICLFCCGGKNQESGARGQESPKAVPHS
ncbi:MAG: hypothetical protein EXR98_00235 [Gemmataceae bacterium]|nr:hypothetical protein [Gemmataceae bacterium]